MRFFDTLIAMDDVLVASGVPPIPPRWRSELALFYGSGARVHAARIGRGGIKSTTAAKCLTAEVVLQDWAVPPGERHWGMAISENIPEGGARLGQIDAYLRILGLPFERAGEQIILLDRPLGFWVRAARIGALSGPRVVAWSVDEAAKLADASGANPAEELVTSLKAASVTHPNARGRVYSTPWGKAGYHYDLIEAGSNDSTIVSIGPTWEYNPAVTQEQTRALESNLKNWEREYAAIPTDSTSSAFDTDAIDRAFIDRPNVNAPSEPIMVLDPSGLKADAFTYAIASYQRDNEWNRWERAFDGSIIELNFGVRIPNPTWRDSPGFLRVMRVGGWEGGSAWKLTATDIVNELSLLCAKYGVKHVVADQREAFTLESMFKAKGLRYHALDWTNQTKQIAVERVRRWLADGTLVLPKHDKLRSELHGFAEKYTANGLITYGARGEHHDDYAALLLTLGLAEINKLIPNSPNKSGGITLGQRRVMPF